MTKSDPFDAVETCSSDPNVTDERGSISTITAGPSVQLVERMSAAIRRLESEKMAAKDELDRVSSQRNEARGEIAALMREVERGKVAGNRVTELEAEVAAINSRYQTTLEMLGEKSELVDELKADVEDVKSMYRDLIERTVK
jgi:chromosome segregation ATPase